jgi:long-chain acyl-CoA synthetase
VAEVGVTGVPHPRLGEAVAAWVVLQHGQDATAEELRAYCKRHLASYKVPKQIEFCTALPKSGVGKVLRRELGRAKGSRQAAPVDTSSGVEEVGDLEPAAAR